VKTSDSQYHSNDNNIYLIIRLNSVKALFTIGYWIQHLSRVVYRISRLPAGTSTDSSLGYAFFMQASILILSIARYLVVLIVGGWQSHKISSQHPEETQWGYSSIHRATIARVDRNAIHTNNQPIYERDRTQSIKLIGRQKRDTLCNIQATVETSEPINELLAGLIDPSIDRSIVRSFVCWKTGLRTLTTLHRNREKVSPNQGRVKDTILIMY
jgi:hypothetical protein